MERSLSEAVFFKLKLYYVRIKPDWMVIVHVNKNRRYEDVPRIALDASNKIIGLGRDAERASYKAGAGAQLLNGFEHPRMVVGDSLIAQATLMMFMRQVHPGWTRALPPMPTMIIHPHVPFTDGLSEVERRILREVGMAAGARRVYVYDSPEELTNEQLASLTSLVIYKGNHAAHNS
ncbi:MAG: hypothetical protein WCF84_16090 [Anaerolineae bacterium]